MTSRADVTIQADAASVHPVGPLQADAAGLRGGSGAPSAASHTASPAGSPGAPDAVPSATPTAIVAGKREPGGGPMPRVAMIGLFAIAAAGALYLGRPVLLPVLVAILLSLLLSPVVTQLERARLARWLGALLVVGGTLASVGTLAYYLAGPAQQWLDAGPERLDELRRKVRLIRAPVEAVKGATDRVAEIATADPGTEAAPGKPPPREVVVERRWSSVVLQNVQLAAIQILTIVILLYFLLSSGDLFLRKLIRVVPTLGDKIRAIEISRTIQVQIGRYFAAVTLINAGLGVVTGAAMLALGMPTPALIGALAALFNFVPYLGPLLTLVLVAIVAIITFDTLTAMLLPPAVFLMLTTIEGQVIQPVVLGRQLSTTPVVVFLWVVCWGWLWGVGGVAIAVPLLVVVKICAEHLPGLAPIAEFLGRD